MEFTPVGLIMIGLWAVALMVRGVTGAAFYTITLIPFGTAAVVNLPSAGGLSFLALQLAAGLTIGMALLRMMTRGSNVTLDVPVPAAVFFLVCLYGIASAAIMPRLFSHQFDVVTYQQMTSGVRASDLFPSALQPLRPMSANVTQPAYMLASFGFFLVMIWVARFKSLGFLARAIFVAAAVNAVLGVLDFFKADALLQLVRTADYTVFTASGILGAERLIGGFPEPSSFGSFSAAFGAFFASAYLDRRDWVTAIAAGVNLAFAFMALSSTAIFGGAILAAWLLIRHLRNFVRYGGRANRIYPTVIAGLAFIALCVGLVLAIAPLQEFVVTVFQSLFLDKAESSSGLERAFWAERGFLAFRETYGLGAGLGSVRANGWLAAYLSNVGLPGTVLFVVFLWLTFFRPLPKEVRTDDISHRARILFRASFAAMLTLIAMQLVAGVIVDPGILFFAFAAIAVVAREVMTERLHKAHRKAKRQPVLLARGVVRPSPMKAPRP